MAPAHRQVCLEEQKLPSDVNVRYLYQPGELEGGRRRATGPVWSLNVYRLGRSTTKPGKPVLYYMSPGQDGPARWFVREELLVVLPPGGVLPKLLAEDFLKQVIQWVIRYCIFVAVCQSIDTIFCDPAF